MVGISATDLPGESVEVQNFRRSLDKHRRGRPPHSHDKTCTRTCISLRPLSLLAELDRSAHNWGEAVTRDLSVAANEGIPEYAKRSGLNAI